MKHAEGSGIEVTEMLADPAPRRRPADSGRRQELIQAAETVFLQQGFAAANMDDVARGARMSKKTLYQFFTSKEALFEAVIADSLEPLMISMPDEEGDEPRAALTAALLRVSLHVLNPKQVGMFRLLCAEGKRSSELAQAFHHAGPGQGEGALERCIRAHAQSGRLRVEDPHAAAAMLFGMAIGAMHIMLILNLREQPEADEVSRQVSTAVDMFLRATELRQAEPG